MSRWIARRNTRLALTLTLSLALAACGGAAPTPPPAQPADQAPAQQAAPTPPPPTPAASGADSPAAANAPAAQDPIDVCGLLSADEVGVILGAAVTSSKERKPALEPGDSTSQGCEYRSDALTRFSLEIYRFPDSTAATSYYDLMGDLGEGIAPSGIGDQASAANNDTTRLASLNTRSGAYYLELSVLSDNPARLVAIQEVAPTVIGRLP